MSHHRTRTICSVIGSSVAAVTATLVAAPAANASCASFFGIGNSAFCTSTPTSVAIAIGNATAHADGLFGAALAIGDNAQATVTEGGLFNLSTALGDDSAAASAYNLSLAVAVGQKSTATAAEQPGNNLRIANVAVTFIPGLQNGSAKSDGVGSVALNIFADSSTAFAQGVGTSAVVAGTYNTSTLALDQFSSATAILTRDAVVSAYGTANAAVSLFSRSVGVQAYSGPLAFAGTILAQNVSITKAGPGFNINGVAVGGAQALHKAGGASVKAAAAAHSAGTTSMATTGRPHKKGSRG